MSAVSSADAGDLTLPSMLSSALSLLGSVNQTHIVERCSPDTGQEFQSTKTSMTLEPTLRVSTSSTEDIPASHSPTQDSSVEQKIPDIYGRSSGESFAYYDHESLSLRMSQATLFSDSTECSLTLPRWGWMCDGELYERQMSAPPISEQDSSSLLPTPSAHEPGGTAEAHLERKNKRDGRHRKSPTHLAYMSNLLPTPRGTDGHGGGKHGDGGPDLKSIAMLLPAVKLLPTPTSMDSRCSGGNSPSDVTLTDAIVRTSIGGHTNPRLVDGKNSPPPRHHSQLTIKEG